MTPYFKEQLGCEGSRTQHDTLTQALQQIADWDSHTAEYAVDYGSNGVRDFYRNIARAALSATQPAQTEQGAGEVVAWCTPDGERCVTARTYEGARKDGGAMWSSMVPFTVPAYTQPAAGADVLDAVSPVGDWSYSHDEERFNGQFDTKEAAIAEGLSCGARFVGQVNHVRDIISDGQIGLDIYERIGEILGDEIGEVAECFTLSPDQQEVLGKVVLDWIESGPGFNCWGIKDSEPIDAAIAASGRQE